MTMKSNTEGGETQPPGWWSGVDRRPVTRAPEFGDHQFTGALAQFSGALADLRDARDQALIRPFGSTVFSRSTPEEDAADVERLVPKEEASDGAEIVNWNVPVYNQDPLRSCVSCAVSSVIQFRDPPNTEPLAPSRLFLYYNSRALEGSQADPQAGTGIRSAIKALQKYGSCPEEDWPYDKQKVVEAPDRGTYHDARYVGRVEYRRVFRRNSEDPLDRLAPVRRAITNNHPVLCGFTVYPSFAEASKRGFVVKLPEDADSNYESPLTHAPENALYRNSSFGHCAVIIGYQGDRFTLVNSWGKGWGTDGTFTMPAAYLADYGLTSDFWVITALDKPPSEPEQPSWKEEAPSAAPTAE